MRKLLFSLLMLIPLAVVAQKHSVSGRVTAEDGKPIAGVTVLELGTSNGTTTNQTGEYKLTFDSKSSLQFSFIGYVTQTISTDSKTTINIVLKEDLNKLDEVVVIGYGSQKKSSMTASVASISAKEASKQIVSNVASAMQGRTPGVDVLQGGGEAGADVKILIRGAGTFGSTEPLYVIDGAFSTNGLKSVNPADIASIEILKDGAAAAIYGSRAANGVVLITTKQGKSGETKIEVNGAYGLQTPSKRLDFMNAEQYRSYATMLALNSGKTIPTQVSNPTDPNLSTDWQDIYLQNAPMYNFSAGISGGGENSTFSASLGYLNQDGIVIKSGYKKYNARVNGSYKKGRLTFSENLAVSHSKKDPKVSMSMGLPIVPAKDAQGRWVSAGNEYYVLGSAISNPLGLVYARDNYITETNVTGNFSIGLNFFKGFDYKLNVAGSYLAMHDYNHTPAYSTAWNADGSPMSGFGQLNTSLVEGRETLFNYVIDNLLTYNTTIKKHSIDALLGTSWMREYNRYLTGNSDANDLGAPSITGYNGAGTIGAAERNSALLSFFARLNYDYDNRYLFSASIRSDESSKFAKAYRVGYFPSVSAGWNISNEKFYNINWMNKVKIRGSWGQLGANFIDPYSFVSLAYGPIPASFNGGRVNGNVTRFISNDLKWETCTTTDLGVELGFLNNSITLSVDYFQKRNDDLLAPLSPLPSSGQVIIMNDPKLQPYFNTASVENKGWEIMLGYNKQFGDFRVDVSGNIAFIKNNVLSLGTGIQPIYGDVMSSKFSDRATITKPGIPLGSFWGYQVEGYDDNGNFKFADRDGVAGIADGDKGYLGSPIPDFTYGLNINLAWRNIDFTAFFNGTHGNEVFAAAKYWYYFNQDSGKPVDAMNSWTPTNKNAKNPIAKTDSFNGGDARPNSWYVEDGSYFRCKNLQIGYTFPSTWTKKAGIQGARIYVGVQNLFTISKYSLYDPEVTSNTLFNRGVDGLYQTPPTLNARQFNIGFNLNF